MPFTPFHFGPGLLIKAALPKHFSLSTFVLANVVMDVEPLYHMLHGDTQLHGASHTVIGAGLIAIAAAVFGRIFIRRALRFYERYSAYAGSPFHLTRTQAWLGALLGTFSHLLLDAVMHGDMHPIAPYSEVNPLLQISWTENVYLFCILAGMLGMLLMFIRAALQPEHSH